MIVTTQSKVLKRLTSANYPIYIGQKLHTQIEHFDLMKEQQVFIVTNQEIAEFYLSPLKTALLEYGVHIDELILPVGEQYKSLSCWQQIIDTLLTKAYSRKDSLIALGGGVITDLTGFVAATYQRGMRYISLPTTLLAQVDAAIGGKTAINHVLGKNLIGTFYHPAAVIIDIDCLYTQSDRQFCSGMAEIIKYGVILDKDFFQWLEQHVDRLIARDKNTLLIAIAHCCQLKADLVTQDEQEQGVRALLNFGHTFGHAIEALCSFGGWLHGECVAVGMLMAADLSIQLGLATDCDKQRLKSLLIRARLPVNRPATIDAKTYLPLMERDKKRTSAAIRVVLNCGLGKGKILDITDVSLLIKAIEHI